MSTGNAAIGAAEGAKSNSRGVEGPSQADRRRGQPFGISGASRLPTRTQGRPRRHAPTLVLLGDAQDLAQGRGLARLGRAEVEVVEDAADGEGVGHEGDDAHALAAAGAKEWIHLVDLGNQPRPAW